MLIVNLLRMEKEEIAQMIITYLEKRPDAADTVEGIARWWLRAEYIDQSVDKVAAALDILIERGILQGKEVEGVGRLYFLKSAK